MEEHKVYHIREIGNEDLTCGYVGVTNDIKNRIRQHRHTGLFTESKELIVLCSGSRNYCLDIEYKLRPKPNMGDNKYSGGESRSLYKSPRTIAEGRPSRATGKPCTTRFKKGQKAHNFGKGKHYILTSPEGDEHLVTSLKIFCKEHNLTPQNLRKVAKGQRNYHKGWKAMEIVRHSGRDER